MEPSRQLTLDLIRPLTPSLDNFVVGRNAEALATLRALARARGEPFLYLWGDAGSGRSGGRGARSQRAPNARVVVLNLPNLAAAACSSAG